MRTSSPVRSPKPKLRLRVVSAYLLLFLFVACALTAYISCRSSSIDESPRSGMLGPLIYRAHHRKGLSDPDLSLHSSISNPDLPKDFDWKAYLLWNPDTRTANVRTMEGAIEHYQKIGKKENRPYQRRPLLLRYSACQGLFNQMYAHLSALILADFLGADVVLPPSVYRKSFQDYFNVDKKKNKVSWTPTNVGHLVNVDALRKQYARKGIKILDTPPYLRFPDCSHPQDAFPNYIDDDLQKEQIIQLSSVYLQSMHIWYIWDKAAAAIVERQQQLAKAGFKNDTTIVLDLPCPFLSIMTLTCLEESMFAAAGLQFNATIQGLADTILRKMNRRSGGSVHGAHLRLEKDAIDWAKILGGVDMYLNEYKKAFSAAGFSQQKHLYIASGLLSYNATKEMQDLMAFLAPFAKEVHYKEKYVKRQVLQGLNPEQLALVDFLVLAKTNMFVGLGSSTFSVYLREYRALMGKPRSHNIFVDSRRIGTDPLFERCTHFAPLDTS